MNIVPRTLVQDCLNTGFGEEVYCLHFSYAFKAFWRQVGDHIMTFETIFSTEQVFTRQFSD